MQTQAFFCVFLYFFIVFITFFILMKYLMIPTNFIFTAELSSEATSSSNMSDLFPRKEDNDVIQQHVSEAFVLNSEFFFV